MRTIPGTALSTVARYVGRNLPYFYPIGMPLFMPSALLARACEHNEKLLRKITWIAPAVGIGLTTAAAYASYGLVSSVFLRGLICGAHSGALGLLSAPAAGSSLGIISLQHVVSNWIGLPDSMGKLDATTHNNIETQADRVAFVAFVVSAVGLTVLGQHPIVSTTAGWGISVTVKMVAMRIMSSFAKPPAVLASPNLQTAQQL